jgi:hypothetical protein
MYDEKQIAKDFFQMKRINVSNFDEIYADKFVLYLFSMIFKYASESLDVLSLSLASKRMDSPSVAQGAKLLDKVVDYLAEKREKIDFPEGIEQGVSKVPIKTFSSLVKEGRERVGQNLFESNSIVHTKIRLNSSNPSFQPIVLKSFSIKRFKLSKEYINLAEGASNLYVTSIGELQSSGRRYFILIPDKFMSNEYDNETTIPFQMSLLVQKDNELIIPNEVTRDYLINYTKNVAEEGSIILLGSESVLASKGSDLNIDKELLKRAARNNRFQVKVGKVVNSITNNLWPPQNNLLFNDDLANEAFMTGLGLITEKTDLKQPSKPNVDSFYRFNNIYQTRLFIQQGQGSELRSEEHGFFMSNLKSFPESTSAKTIVPTSSLGVLVPLKYDSSSKNLRNTISHINNITSAGSGYSNLTYVSDKSIFINSSSGSKINISWAFKNLDPQYTNKEGNLRIKLVQSGTVQKLNYINQNINIIYNDLCNYSIKDKTTTYLDSFVSMLNYLTEQDFVSPSRVSTLENFLYFLFDKNVDNKVISFYRDPNYGYSLARLTEQAELNLRSSGIILKLEEEVSKLIIESLRKLVDYHNASFVLNYEYNKLNPAMQSSNNFADINSGEEKISLYLQLLDPYSLWNMINNPMMRTQYGGQIEDSDVEDLKIFVINSFGIESFRDFICKKTNIDISLISPEDLFDLPGCYRKLSMELKDQKVKLNSFSKLLGLHIENGDVATYNNGFPVTTSRTKEITDALNNLNTSEYLLNEESYISHSFSSDFPRHAGLENVFRSKHLEKKEEEPEVAPPGKDFLFSSKKRGPPVLSKEEKERKAAEEKEKEMKLREEFKKWIKDLQDGNATITLEMLANEGLRRSSAGAKTNPYFDEQKAFSEQLYSVLSSMYSKISTANKKHLSWRNIYKTSGDEASTMISAMYDDLWEKYLEIMSNVL